MSSRRPAGLRSDIAMVDINDVASFEELLNRALTYQLEKPVEMLDAVVIDRKTFIFA